MTWIFGERRKNIMQDIIDDIQLPKELLEKRGVDLTGEDFYIIMSAVIKNMTKLTSHYEPIYIRGKKELAEYLRCSISTINRWIDTKVIHDEAIIRRDRYIMFEANEVIKQLRENDCIRFKPRNSK